MSRRQRRDATPPHTLHLSSPFIPRATRHDVIADAEYAIVITPASPLTCHRHVYHAETLIVAEQHTPLLMPPLLSCAVKHIHANQLFIPRSPRKHTPRTSAPHAQRDMLPLCLRDTSVNMHAARLRRHAAPNISSMLPDATF